MQALSEVHSKARDLISRAVSNGRSAVQEEHARYKSSSSDTSNSLLGLEAQVVENDQITERVPLLLEWDNVREKLLIRNPRLGALSSSFVSGRLSDK